MLANLGETRWLQKQGGRMVFVMLPASNCQGVVYQEAHEWMDHELPAGAPEIDDSQKCRDLVQALPGNGSDEFFLHSGNIWVTYRCGCQSK